MKTFAVESIALDAQPNRVFAYLANPENLPQWTSAFKSVQDRKAQMVTSAGCVEVGLETIAVAPAGSIDWKIVFPDGTVAMAYSRVTPAPNGGSIYTFVLPAPPVPLEQLEGALEQQVVMLRQELERLAGVLK